MAIPETEPLVSTEEESSVSGEPDTIDPTGVEEFERRVAKLCEMMENDPRVRDRVIAEIYVNFANVEIMFRQMIQLMQDQGVAGLMKGMIGRRKKNDD